MRSYAIIAIALLPLLGVAASDGQRPLWSYHNGNTLAGYNQDYQNGFIIGVIDGYLAAHDRMRHDADSSPMWLDECVAAGWPAPRLADRLRREFRQAFREYKKPAAEYLLARLRELCRR